MRRVVVMTVALAAAAGPRAAWGQFGGFGGRGGRGGGSDMAARAFPAPKLPGAELEGPPDSAAARAVLTLDDAQAVRYTQAYDSFMTATRPQRDSAAIVTDKMNDRLANGDRAAAMFYADRLREFGDFLKDRQEKFETSVRRFLTGDQVKAYRKWKEGQDRIYEEKNREAALRWQRPSMGERGGFGGLGGGGGGGGGTPADTRTVIPNVAGVAHQDLGAQAVRVGRTLYVASQLALDSAGRLLQGDLRAQADRAFANLAAVLRAASAQPQDVVALTVYVVGYKPDQLAIVRGVVGASFGPNPPTVTVLGVDALSREGALIAVGATAVIGSASWFARMDGDR